MKKDRNNKNHEIAIVAYLFAFLFVGLIGYFVYFMVIDSQNVINNPYNKRQELLAERVIRGEIQASDGTVLAETKTNSKGEEYRSYPYDAIFCHAVGRADKGKTGVELSQNIRLLTSHENPLTAFFKELKGEKNIGDNVVTTLDVSLQKVAYQALGSRKGAIVVMEPDTGKILAMVSKPDYNPNKVVSNWEYLVEDSENNSALLNRATQGLYPPGSTFKTLVAIEYIRENGGVKYSYTCDGSDTFEDVKINCYGNKKHGEEDLKKSFAKSCNASFANIGMGLDVKAFKSLCESFLFNKKLPVDFAYNHSSFVLNSSSSKSEIPQTMIGQGDTQITPLHNAMIVAGIANDGKMMKPYMVDRIESYTGNVVKQYQPALIGEPMTKAEAKKLQNMMEAVVEEGTATALNTGSYTAAGKTGSAEFDSTKASHSWFIGYAKKKEKQLAVSIIVEGAGTGSEYAVPIARKIFDSYLK
ncbi:MAG: peptidoglycan D,D-transpeptidase FtsI family protein [Acetivibrio ethanolgignens]